MSDAYGGGCATALPGGEPSRETPAGQAGLRCQFDHPFFAWFHSNGGGRFRFDEASGGGAFHVQITADMHFALPLGPLARELGLSEGNSPDAARLRMVGEAVNYVETLELGAELPAEVTTGGASWSLPDRYLAAARSELTQRLVALLAEHQDDGTVSPAELFDVLAALGHETPSAGGPATATAARPRDSRTLRVDGLVEGLARIDCLRDRSTAALSVLSAGAGAALNVLPPRSEASGAAAGLLRVLAAAGKRVARDLETASREPENIAFALADPEPACRSLATWRNKLYAEVRRLQAAMRPWQGLMLAADAATKALVFNTYRAMGRRDLPADSWATLEAKLAAALLPAGTKIGRNEPGAAGLIGARMIWSEQTGHSPPT